MHHLKSWLRRHPYLALLLCSLFTLLSALMAVCDAQWLSLAFCVLVCVFVLSYWKDARNGVLTLLLTFWLAGAPLRAAPPERKVAGAIIGVTVICIGGYCVYKLVRFCQKHFPKTPATNSPPELVSQEMGSSWTISGDGCDEDTSAIPTTFMLTITPGEPPTMTASANHETQDRDGFLKEMRAHGLDLDAAASCAMAGVPVAAVPITFVDGVVRTAANAPAVVIERSVDMMIWQPLLTVASAQPFAVVDTTAQRQVFYRLR